jgi:hypothetical protein
MSKKPKEETKPKGPKKPKTKVIFKLTINKPTK